MLQRDSREIVNNGRPPSPTLKDETSCTYWDLVRAERAPNRYCTPCANVPDIFWGVISGIVCAAVILEIDEKGGALGSDVGEVWAWLRSVGEWSV